MRLSSPVPKKRARIEIIPLIDIMFFLLASFMMVSLEPDAHERHSRQFTGCGWAAANRGEGLRLDQSAGRKRGVLRQRSIVPDDQVMPRLFQLHRANKDIKISISAQPMAMYGDVIGVLDKVRSVGITKVGYQIRAAGGVTQTGAGSSCSCSSTSLVLSRRTRAVEVYRRARESLWRDG